MRIFLVGNTGFVGSNLAAQYQFDGLFSSKNIENAYDSNPDLLIYSGVPSQKFIANENPLQDEKIIDCAINNIKRINPKKIVLISTIDIYDNPNNVYEDSDNFNKLEAYGRNRHKLEEWIQEYFCDYLIVRLPGLYGNNIKKNFIYDLINIIPNMIKYEKFAELTHINPILKIYYTKLENGFYKCKILSYKEKQVLSKTFKKLNFTALNFTDSRAKFQFYNLANLWSDISIALEHNLKIINLATEPIGASELYNYIYGKEFKNEISLNIPNYNYKTKYCKIYGGEDGYILKKEVVMSDIKQFVKKMESR